MITAFFLSLVLGCASPEPEPPADWWKGETGWCGEPLTAEHLDAAVALGRDYLVRNQLPDGNFLYEYDWRTGEVVDGDNEVRQAGATWGLALAHRADPTPETKAGVLNAIAFWRKHEIELNGRRWIEYPKQRFGRLGTLSLVLLAHIELLRTDDPELDRPALNAAVDGYVAQILHLTALDGRLHDRIIPKIGRGFGMPSPYSEGEALLALVKTARYLEREDLWPAIERIAKAGYEENVVAARAEEPDSDTTKGYYQWSSMSWYEIVGSKRPGSEVWGERLIELAVWMIDTHRTLQRTRNTAYAYEGLVPAYAVARERQDPRAAKLGCVVQLGLRKLESWQLGHPLAIPYVAAASPDDPRAHGGVQNAADEALLRIDVVQHQTHAMLLARELWAPAQQASK